MANRQFIKADPDDQSHPDSSYFLGNSPYPQAGPGGAPQPPQDIPFSSSFQQNAYPFQQQNSFGFGNSSIADAELLDLDLNPPSQQDTPNLNPFQDAGMGLSQQQQQQQAHHQNLNLGGVYSSTPHGDPIQSPFMRPNFDYSQFRDMSSSMPHTTTTNPSAHANANTTQNVTTAASPGIASLNAAFESSLFSSRGRQIMHGGMGPSRTRFGSLDLTPTATATNNNGNTNNAPTPIPTTNQNDFALAGTPDIGGGSFPQPIRGVSMQNRHHRMSSSHWDDGASPLSSPAITFSQQPQSHQQQTPHAVPPHPQHHAIVEMLKTGRHASLPAKISGVGPASLGAPGSVPDPTTLESQEAKRRRRRASHNMVERRRRDNINERIQELSHLVPHHRLEDDKVRKQLLNSASLASGAAVSTGMSPPTPGGATSLLAGGAGRRAATGVGGATPGNITLGLPIEEKEKGPNKGDILNGAVAWTRDLMWALYVKLQQEAELAEVIANLGGTWPFETSEEERRIRTELLEAVERNDPGSFGYSRGPGSGLRVPKHTNLAGEPLEEGKGQGQGGQQGGQRKGTPSGEGMNLGTATSNTASLSPAFTAGGSGANSGSSAGAMQGQQQGQGEQGLWEATTPSFGFREEDEYAMEL